MDSAEGKEIAQDRHISPRQRESYTTGRDSSRNNVLQALHAYVQSEHLVGASSVFYQVGAVHHHDNL